MAHGAIVAPAQEQGRRRRDVHAGLRVASGALALVACIGVVAYTVKVGSPSRDLSGSPPLLSPPHPYSWLCYSLAQAGGQLQAIFARCKARTPLLTVHRTKEGFYNMRSPCSHRGARLGGGGGAEG